jgi:hypothetical protein
MLHLFVGAFASVLLASLLECICTCLCAALRVQHELVHVSACTQHSGRVAYCSDRPWIINASVRDNIVLGASSAYTTNTSSSSSSSSSGSEEKYTAVVAACALDVDMAEWPAGDSTIIGEKGNYTYIHDNTLHYHTYSCYTGVFCEACHSVLQLVYRLAVGCAVSLYCLPL